MGNKTRNTNYDYLDKILADADRKDGSGRTWVPDPRHKDRGYWADNAQSFGARSGQGVDDIEKYLRS